MYNSICFATTDAKEHQMLQEPSLEISRISIVQMFAEYFLAQE